MKRSNSKQKAQSAFWKLGAVALITATMFFTACKQTGGGGESTPKHAVTFSVDGGNGTLKAKADGVPETSTSPINIEEGKTVTFTAKANDGYRVKGWTLDGSAVNGTNTEYKLKVSKSATVSVSFTKKTYAVNFSVAGTGGTLKAEGDGITQPATSPITVEHGKEVIFTATANEGYKIGKWTVTPETALQAGTGTDGSKTAKVKITADTSISVSFELIPKAILTLDPNKFTIKVRAVTEDDSAITVEGCAETTLANDTETELHATGTTVILKGNIIELACVKNQLTELNVQGLSSLQSLWCSENQLLEFNVQGLPALKEFSCYSNKLNAQAMTKLLNDLPDRKGKWHGAAFLYTEKSDVTEENHKDYTQPEDLRKAFDGAKKRNWKLIKLDHRGNQVVL